MHLHGERDRRVVPEQNQYFRDSGAAQHRFDLAELRIRQFGTRHQRGGERVDSVLMRVGQLGILAGTDRVDRGFRNPGIGPAFSKPASLLKREKGRKALPGVRGVTL